MLNNTHRIWLSVGFTIIAILSASVWLLLTGGSLSVNALIRLYIPEIIFWNVWILVAPMIFWVARRYSFSISPVSWKWVVHIPIALLFIVGTFVLYLVFLSLLFLLSSFVGLTEQGMLMNEIQSRVRGLIGIGIPLGAMLYGLLVVLSHVQNYYQRLRDEEHRSTALKGQLAQAELQALRMQLHPHFLFNSLNTISATLQTDTKAADKMLAELGDFLRITLENADRTHVSLREEVEFVKKYLEIEQHRFEDRLGIQYDIAASVEEASVPYLILQPLVENAIKHGVGQTLGASRIKISAYEEEGLVCIDVFNSGSQLDGALAEPPLGVGLSNTRSRLHQLYGDDGTLRMQNVEAGGVQVRLQLPLSINQSPVLVEAQ